MVQPTRREAKAGLEIIGLEIRHLIENLLRGQPRREQIEDVTHTNAHPTDTRTSSALLRVDGDSFRNRPHRLSIRVDARDHGERTRPQ